MGSGQVGTYHISGRRTDLLKIPVANIYVFANIFLFSKIAAMTNQARDAHDSTVSAKDKRKARKELEAARREYEAKMAILAAEEEGNTGKASVSNMVIPDYRSGRNEKDIQQNIQHP